MVSGPVRCQLSEGSGSGRLASKAFTYLHPKEEDHGNMTSVTPKRRRRLALAAAGTAAAMVLLPAAASAQQDNPFDDTGDEMRGTAEQIENGQAPNVTGPAAPGEPGVLETVPDEDGEAPDGEGVNPDLGTPVEDDDEEGHETDDPQFPDAGRGEVADIDFGEDNETDIAKVTGYEAEITDDGEAQSGVTVLGLLGEEVVGSESSSEGDNESGENPTEGLCEGSEGALCLSLLYHETESTETDESLDAFAQGGVLALCLGGDNEDANATYECNAELLSAGVAEGFAGAQRDDDGNTKATSENETASLCLGGQNDDRLCEGLGAKVLHADSSSSAEDGDYETERNSYLLGIETDGESEEIVDEPTGLAIPPGCGGEDDEDPALLCVFFNQGESFEFGNGAASAQEALHVDVLRNTGLDVLAEIGQAESVAREFDCEPKNPEGPCPGDGDNGDDDKKPGDDGKDDGAGDNGDKDDGLATTGADIAPMAAGALALIGLGALSMAATRRRVGKHIA